MVKKGYYNVLNTESIDSGSVKLHFETNLQGDFECKPSSSANVVVISSTSSNVMNNIESYSVNCSGLVPAEIYSVEVSDECILDQSDKSSFQTG